MLKKPISHSCNGTLECHLEYIWPETELENSLGIVQEPEFASAWHSSNSTGDLFPRSFSKLSPRSNNLDAACFFSCKES